MSVIVQLHKMMVIVTWPIFGNFCKLSK